MQEKIIAALSPFSPYSIFIYGSRGRGDSTTDSDYEIGVVFEDNSYTERSIIHESVRLEGVRIYPFKLSEIQSGILNTPFVNSIYLRELIEGGKTIGGKEVIESLTPIPITTLDLVRRIRFDIGYSLAALLSYRSGDTATAFEELSKSCLFGLRTLGILKLKKSISGYDAIYKSKSELTLQDDYLRAIEAAYSIRQGKKDIPIDAIFDNISFLNYVEAEILEELKLSGITDLV